ncbi:NHD1, partial [Symbiodinium sp. KB8]
IPLISLATAKLRGLGGRAFRVLRRSTRTTEDVRGEVTGVVVPVLAGLTGWLALMYSIQHSIVTVPFLTGAQYEYFPIVATFVAGYTVIVLEEQTEINKVLLDLWEMLTVVHIEHVGRRCTYSSLRGPAPARATSVDSLGCLPGILALGVHSARATRARRARATPSMRKTKNRADAKEEHLPRCVVFDLDGCLWYPEMYELSWQGGGAPFSRDDLGKIRDRRGNAIRLHSGVDAALTELATDPKWRGVVVAVASCCDVPPWAHELLGKFEFGPDRKRLASIIEVHQIHKGSKQTHFREICGMVGCDFDEMIFFDNEKYNCDEVSRLGSVLGWTSVTCIYCPDGVTSTSWVKGIKAFPALGEAATALILGVLVWALVGTGVDMTASAFDVAIKETLEDVSEVVFFLLGALTIVEIMDAHKGFDIITKLIQAKTQRELLVIVSVLTFVLSSVLNNLTVVIVMVSLLQKLVKDEDFRMRLGGVVVVASNAGGAWTPIGDITTTMLYIGGQVTTVPLLANLFIPSVLCLIGTVGFELTRMDDKPFERTPSSPGDDEIPNGQAVVFWGGLIGMITVPAFTAITQCPAWSGMMLVLGLLGLITSLLHEPDDNRYSLKGALTRVEVPDALFFLGVLFAVGGLERVGLLKEFAIQLSNLVPSDALVAIFLGFASAVVDNVPLVAAAQGMYDISVHPANDSLWNLITYCAATGGSLLVIGSAAGVAFMGMERNVSFGWYAKSVAPAALVGYFLGVAGVLGQQALGLSVA